MAKKIIAMTTAQVEAVVEKEDLGVFNGTGKDAVRTPNSFGVSMTKTGRFLAYCVDGGRKMYNTSVHDTEEIANGRVVERMRAEKLRAERTAKMIEEAKAEKAEAMIETETVENVEATVEAEAEAVENAGAENAEAPVEDKKAEEKAA